MRSQALLSWVVAGAVGLAGAGCDWRDFDKIAGTTPVAAIGPPSGFGASDDFGRVMLAVRPPADGSAAARFVGSAVSQTAIGVINLDAQGHASGQAVTGPALDLLDGVPVTAMAESAGSGRVLLGAPDASAGGALLLIKLESPYEVTSFFTSGEPQFGAGVAAGQLAGGAADDLVTLSTSTLHVFVDGQASSSAPAYTDSGAADPCPIFLSTSLSGRARLNRPVAIAPLTGTSPQIVVGTPSPTTTTPGTVSIFNVDTTTGVASCALKLSGPEALFGVSVTVGDFNNDGRRDLLVGAPPTHAYLFLGPITATPTATITGSSGTAFGSSVAAINLDGTGGDEALVADVDATVSGQTLAGNVTIYSGPMLGTKVMPTPAVSVLAPHDVSAGDAYGSSVAALRFCPPAADAGAGTCAQLPLVGSASKAFAYYTLGPTDPRAK